MSLACCQNSGTAQEDAMLHSLSGAFACTGLNLLICATCKTLQQGTPLGQRGHELGVLREEGGVGALPF